MLGVCYKIPDDILAKIPEHFWPAFAGELVSVFGPNLFETCGYEDGTVDSHFNYIGGTSGWHAALKMTCRKLDMEWLWDYYQKLEWYDSDLFDSDIETLVKTKFIDATPHAPNEYYLWVVGQDPIKLKTGYCPICDKEVETYSNTSYGYCSHCHHHLVLHDKEEKPTVAYICDRKQCEDCSSDAGFCYHTLDINHAVNFEEVELGKWMEKE